MICITLVFSSNIAVSQLMHKYKSLKYQLRYLHFRLPALIQLRLQANKNKLESLINMQNSYFVCELTSILNSDRYRFIYLLAAYWTFSTRLIRTFTLIPFLTTSFSLKYILNTYDIL